MSATPYLQDTERFKAQQKSRTADDGSLRGAHTGSNYDMLLHALIERVKEATCSQCELACGDSVARTGYTDLPMFYCDAFCNAYFAETDAQNQEGPVERELWASAQMWKAHLFHTRCG
ncbi:MAG: hypothetical protein ACXV5F_02545 [Halobacteriota archaeon]